MGGGMLGNVKFSKKLGSNSEFIKNINLRIKNINFKTLKMFLTFEAFYEFIQFLGIIILFIEIQKNGI
jgi:hypothetical protein